MFRSLILSIATIGVIALGSSTSASAQMGCSPYVGGMCGQDTRIGLGAMVYHMLGGGGGYGYGGGYRYGYHYGYQQQYGMPMYHQPAPVPWNGDYDNATGMLVRCYFGPCPPIRPGY